MNSLLLSRLQTVSACFRPEIRADIVAQAQTITSDADLELFVEWWETRRDYHAAVAVEEMER